MNERLEVIRDGYKFAVKITYYSGRIDIERGFATEMMASAWIANRQQRAVIASANEPTARA